jgi:hypothetical protein
MNYTITVSEVELQTIYSGLGQLLLKDALNTFGSIQTQIQKQAAPPAPDTAA